MYLSVHERGPWAGPWPQPLLGHVQFGLAIQPPPPDMFELVHYVARNVSKPLRSFNLREERRKTPFSSRSTPAVEVCTQQKLQSNERIDQSCHRIVLLL